MKLYAYLSSLTHSSIFLASINTDKLLEHNRLMSDYEVTLVNDNMQEFFVRFHGPVESEFNYL